MIIDLYQQSKIGEAQSMADNARSKAASVADEMARLAARVEKLALTCQSLYELIREKTGISDQDIADKIHEIDMRDGKLDGKISFAILDCPACGNKTNSKRSTCVFCGNALEKQHAFEV